MGNAMVGPASDYRASELRSIADTVEPVYPSAAYTLRGIARSLEPEPRKASYELAITTSPIWLYDAEDDEPWVLWTTEPHGEWSVQQKAVSYPNNIYYFESVEDA